MTAEDVIEFYQSCEDTGVDIWIDGGWAIDAAIGHQTRTHSDLDIAINETNLPALLKLLEDCDFQEKSGPEINGDWNRVFVSRQGAQLDVHIFWLDERGRGVMGREDPDNAYPVGSFDGLGMILNKRVRCTPPAIMFGFKTSYASKEKDISDIEALSKAFGFVDPR